MPPTIAVTALVFVAPTAAAAAAATIIIAIVIITIAVATIVSAAPATAVVVIVPTAITVAIPATTTARFCCSCHNGCCIVHKGLICVAIVALSLPPQGLFLIIASIAVATALGIIACLPPLSSFCVVRRWIALPHLPHIVCHPLILRCPLPPPFVVLSIALLALCCPSPPPHPVIQHTLATQVIYLGLIVVLIIPVECGCNKGRTDGLAGRFISGHPWNTMTMTSM